MLPKGTRIYYRGDMANFEDFGTITGAYTNKWGSFYDVSLDDGRGLEGLPTIAITDYDSGNGSTRIVTLRAYKERLLTQTPKESPFYQFVVNQVNNLA